MVFFYCLTYGKKLLEVKIENKNFFFYGVIGVDFNYELCRFV